MKSGTKNNKGRVNGGGLTRRELLAAHQRSLRHDEKLSAQEGLDALVRAGIVTRGGKLTPRYGG